RRSRQPRARPRCQRWKQPTAFARRSAAASRSSLTHFTLGSPARSISRPRGASSADLARRSDRPELELADEADLRLEMHAAVPLDGVLSHADQLPDIFRGRAAEIHHDVRMNMRNLRTTHTKSL